MGWTVPFRQGLSSLTPMINEQWWNGGRASVWRLSPCWQCLGYWPGTGGWCPHSAPLCPRAGPECGRCRNSPGGGGEEHTGETCPTGQGGGGGVRRRRRRRRRTQPRGRLMWQGSKHLGICAVTGRFIGGGEWRENKSDDNRQQRGGWLTGLSHQSTIIAAYTIRSDGYGQPILIFDVFPSLLGHSTHVNADPKDIWLPIELRWMKIIRSCDKWQMIWKPPIPFSNTLERLLEFAKSHQRRQHEPPDSWPHSQLGGKKTTTTKKKSKIHAAWYSYQERHGVLLAVVESQALAFIRSQAAGDRPRWRETGRGGRSSAAAAAAAAV